MLQQTPLTPVAAPATKASLMERFKIYGKRTVRAEMNDVIRINRQCALKEAKDQKVLRPSEVEELARRFA